jgi:hypothetical protein
MLKQIVLLVLMAASCSSDSPRRNGYMLGTVYWHEGAVADDRNHYRNHYWDSFIEQADDEDDMLAEEEARPAIWLVRRKEAQRLVIRSQGLFYDLTSIIIDFNAPKLLRDLTPSAVTVVYETDLGPPLQIAIATGRIVFDRSRSDAGILSLQAELLGRHPWAGLVGTDGASRYGAPVAITASVTMDWETLSEDGAPTRLSRFRVDASD